MKFPLCTPDLLQKLMDRVQMTRHRGIWVLADVSGPLRWDYEAEEWVPIQFMHASAPQDPTNFST